MTPWELLVWAGSISVSLALIGLTLGLFWFLITQPKAQKPTRPEQPVNNYNDWAPTDQPLADWEKDLDQPNPRDELNRFRNKEH